MQTFTRKDTDNLGMIVKRVSVPIGLEELMEGLTKEVLLKKPKDLYIFASEYFSRLVVLREQKKGYPIRTVQSVTHLKVPDIIQGKKILTPRPTRQLSRQLRNKSPVDSKNIQTETKRTITRRSREQKDIRESKEPLQSLVKRERSTSTTKKDLSTSRSTSSVQSTPREKRQSSYSRYKSNEDSSKSVAKQSKTGKGIEKSKSEFVNSGIDLKKTAKEISQGLASMEKLTETNFLPQESNKTPQNILDSDIWAATTDVEQVSQLINEENNEKSKEKVKKIDENKQNNNSKFISNDTEVEDSGCSISNNDATSEKSEFHKEVATNKIDKTETKKNEEIKQNSLNGGETHLKVEVTNDSGVYDNFEEKETINRKQISTTKGSQGSKESSDNNIVNKSVTKENVLEQITVKDSLNSITENNVKGPSKETSETKQNLSERENNREDVSKDKANKTRLNVDKNESTVSEANNDAETNKTNLELEKNESANDSKNEALSNTKIFHVIEPSKKDDLTSHVHNEKGANEEVKEVNKSNLSNEKLEEKIPDKADSKNASIQEEIEINTTIEKMKENANDLKENSTESKTKKSVEENTSTPNIQMKSMDESNDLLIVSISPIKTEGSDEKENDDTELKKIIDIPKEEVKKTTNFFRENEEMGSKERVHVISDKNLNVEKMEGTKIEQTKIESSLEESKEIAKERQEEALSLNQSNAENNEMDVVKKDVSFTDKLDEPPTSTDTLDKAKVEVKPSLLSTSLDELPVKKSHLIKENTLAFNSVKDLLEFDNTLIHKHDKGNKDSSEESNELKLIIVENESADDNTNIPSDNDGLSNNNGSNKRCFSSDEIQEISSEDKLIMKISSDIKPKTLDSQDTDISLDHDLISTDSSEKELMDKQNNLTKIEGKQKSNPLNENKKNDTKTNKMSMEDKHKLIDNKKVAISSEDKDKQIKQKNSVSVSEDSDETGNPEVNKPPKIGDIKQIATVIEVVKNIYNAKSTEKTNISELRDYLNNFLYNEQKHVFKSEKSQPSSLEPMKNENSAKKKSMLPFRSKQERPLSPTNQFSYQKKDSDTKLRRSRSVGVIKTPETESRSKIPTSARRSASRRPLVRQLEADSKELEEKLKSTSKGSREDASKNINGVAKDDVLIAKTILKGVEGAEKHIELIEEHLSNLENDKIKAKYDPNVLKGEIDATAKESLDIITNETKTGILKNSSLETVSNAALVIQRIWKGFQARKILKESKFKANYFKLSSTDDKKIDAKMNVEKDKERNKIEHAGLFIDKKEHEAAIKIQSAWKSFVAMKMLRNANKEVSLSKNEEAIITIQAIVRGFLQRSKYEKLKTKNIKSTKIEEAVKEENLDNNVVKQENHVLGKDKNTKSPNTESDENSKAQTKKEVRARKDESPVLKSSKDNPDSDKDLNKTLGPKQENNLSKDTAPKGASEVIKETNISLEKDKDDLLSDQKSNAQLISSQPPRQELLHSSEFHATAFLPGSSKSLETLDNGKSIPTRTISLSETGNLKHNTSECHDIVLTPLLPSGSDINIVEKSKLILPTLSRDNITQTVLDTNKSSEDVRSKAESDQNKNEENTTRLSIEKVADTHIHTKMVESMGETMAQRAESNEKGCIKENSKINESEETNFSEENVKENSVLHEASLNDANVKEDNKGNASEVNSNGLKFKDETEVNKDTFKSDLGKVLVITESKEKLRESAFENDIVKTETAVDEASKVTWNEKKLNEKLIVNGDLNKDRVKGNSDDAPLETESKVEAETDANNKNKAAINSKNVLGKEENTIERSFAKVEGNKNSKIYSNKEDEKEATDSANVPVIKDSQIGEVDKAETSIEKSETVLIPDLVMQNTTTGSNNIKENLTAMVAASKIAISDFSKDEKETLDPKNVRVIKNCQIGEEGNTEPSIEKLVKVTIPDLVKQNTTTGSDNIKENSSAMVEARKIAKSDLSKEDKNNAVDSKNVPVIKDFQVGEEGNAEPSMEKLEKVTIPDLVKQNTINGSDNIKENSTAMVAVSKIAKSDSSKEDENKAVDSKNVPVIKDCQVGEEGNAEPSMEKLEKVTIPDLVKQNTINGSDNIKENSIAMVPSSTIIAKSDSSGENENRAVDPKNGPIIKDRHIGEVREAETSIEQFKKVTIPDLVKQNTTTGSNNIKENSSAMVAASKIAKSDSSNEDEKKAVDSKNIPVIKDSQIDAVGEAETSIEKLEKVTILDEVKPNTTISSDNVKKNSSAIIEVSKMSNSDLTKQETLKNSLDRVEETNNSKEKITENIQITTKNKDNKMDTMNSELKVIIKEKGDDFKPSEKVLKNITESDSDKINEGNNKNFVTQKGQETADEKSNKSERNNKEASKSVETDENKLSDAKPDFYRSDTVVEPEIIKKCVSDLRESSTDFLASQQDDKDDNNNRSKEETDIEKNVRNAVKKIVSTTPLEIEINQTVRDVMENKSEKTKKNQLDSMISVETEIPTDEISKTIFQKNEDTTKHNIASDDSKQQNDNKDEIHSQISQNKTFDNDGKSVETPTNDDVSSIGSIDSIVTVTLKPKQDKDTADTKKLAKKLPNKALSTSAIEDHVVLLDQVQNSLLDQLSGKTVDTNSKFDIDQLRKELHDAATMYTSEGDHENDNDQEVMEYLYDFDPEEDSTYETRMKTPLRELPDIAEETESKEEDGFCGTLNNDNKYINQQAEIIKPPKSHEIVIDNGNIKINKNDQKLLHTSELHDSLLVPTAYEFLHSVQGESSNLKHTSEFHDTVVLPLPSGSDVTITNASKNLLPHDGSRHENQAITEETSSQMPPAGASKTMTSPSRRRSQNGVIEAQASLKDTSSSSAKPEPGELVTHQSLPLQMLRSVEQNMESEQNNNKRNNAITKNVSAAEKNMEVQAATKIQAGFRGYQVRKQLKAKNVATDQKRQIRKRSSRENIKEIDLEEKSAVKIQAGVRGFLVRRRQKKQVSGSASA